MNILHEIWNVKEDGKYVSSDSIRRCWRKASILPVTWETDINNDVGSASLPKKLKMISKEQSDELCELMDGKHTDSGE